MHHNDSMCGVCTVGHQDEAHCYSDCIIVHAETERRDWKDIQPCSLAVDASKLCMGSRIMCIVQEGVSNGGCFEIVPDILALLSHSLKRSLSLDHKSSASP